MELKIDKSAWVPVTLGEVAFEVSDRIDAPAESEYDRFVGLEHFVSGELKIKQWESGQWNFYRSKQEISRVSPPNVDLF